MYISIKNPFKIHFLFCYLASFTVLWCHYYTCCHFFFHPIFHFYFGLFAILYLIQSILEDASLNSLYDTFRSFLYVCFFSVNDGFRITKKKKKEWKGTHGIATVFRICITMHTTRIQTLLFLSSVIFFSFFILSAIKALSFKLRLYLYLVLFSIIYAEEIRCYKIRLLFIFTLVFIFFFFFFGRKGLNLQNEHINCVKHKGKAIIVRSSYTKLRCG